MVFIISILTQFIACVYASDINRKTNDAFHFFLHEILWKTFKAILSICFVVVDKATQ